jgi:hypothetical protein
MGRQAALAFQGGSCGGIVVGGVNVSPLVAARGISSIAGQDVADELDRLRDQIAQIQRGEEELRPYREYLDAASNAYRSFLEATGQRGDS